MPRTFKPRTRQPNLLRDARLIVIAAEGTETEKKYFEDLATHEKYRNPKVHVEVIQRVDTASSPRRVIRDLDKFCREYSLNKFDELWLVIDVDRWTPSELSDVATQCQQKIYSLAISNPNFEVWLLLHLISFASYTSDEINELTVNQRVGSRTRLEMEIQKILGEYNKSNLKTSHFIPQVETAIERAEYLDTHPEHRWTNQLGTRVYLLAKSIINKLST